jgi:hypothetical protein
MQDSISRWLALALVIGIANPLEAQHPQVRKGFWIGFGPTYGSGGVEWDGHPTTREGSFGGFFRLGGTLSRKVLLGAEVNSWYKNESGVYLLLGNVAAVVYYYPKATSGWFIKGGPGISSMFSGVGPGLEDHGWGVTTGIGYDIRVGRNISLTPVANFWFGHTGDVKANGAIVYTGWEQNVFEGGLGITFH